MKMIGGIDIDVRDCDGNMSQSEYAGTQSQLLTLARLLRTLPLQRFINQAENAVNLGCFLDPTAWMKGVDNLQELLKLAHALRTAQQIADELSAREVKA